MRFDVYTNRSVCRPAKTADHLVHMHSMRGIPCRHAHRSFHPAQGHRIADEAAMEWKAA